MLNLMGGVAAAAGTPSALLSAAINPVTFVDVARSSGILFQHDKMRLAKRDVRFDVLAGPTQSPKIRCRQARPQLLEFLDLNVPAHSSPESRHCSVYMRWSLGSRSQPPGAPGKRLQKVLDTQQGSALKGIINIVYNILGFSQKSL
jgi:hypothetical protein